MITLIVERTIRNNDTCWVALSFLVSLLLRANHDQRQLASRLPHFIFLDYLLRVCRHVLGSLVVA